MIVPPLGVRNRCGYHGVPAIPYRLVRAGTIDESIE